MASVSRWASGLPVVTVPTGDQPRPVTFVYPYYDNPDFLRRQIAWWSTYPAWLRAQISAVMVDDGSPTTHLADVLAGLQRPFPMRLFRIERDVPWNWLAARNIGLHHAPEGWCLMTDIDHVVPESTATALVYGRHDPETIYGLSRIEHTGEALGPHPNSWFLTRERFWSVGGYDETLSGHYGSDGDWRRRCAEAGPVRILNDRLVRHEFVADASTTKYARKLPADVTAVQRILSARVSGWRPRVLSFAYHEVPA